MYQGLTYLIKCRAAGKSRRRLRRCAWFRR